MVRHVETGYQVLSFQAPQESPLESTNVLLLHCCLAMNHDPY